MQVQSEGLFGILWLESVDHHSQVLEDSCLVDLNSRCGLWFFGLLAFERLLFDFFFSWGRRRVVDKDRESNHTEAKCGIGVLLAIEASFSEHFLETSEKVVVDIWV